MSRDDEDDSVLSDASGGTQGDDEMSQGDGESLSSADESVDENPSRWKALAIFGDSSAGVFFSILMLAISVAISWYLEEPQRLVADQVTVTATEAYRSLGPVPFIDPPKIWEWKPEYHDGSILSIPSAMLRAFEIDGVVAIRGLLDPDLIDRLDAKSADWIQEEYQRKQVKPRGALTGRPKGGTQFFMVQEGTLFHDVNSSTPVDISKAPFLETAMYSDIPVVVATLLDLVTNVNEETPKENLRIMRDIFLAKDNDPYICGWHVDDTGFWPAEAEATGINAWIALDDMPVQGGGGFALAVGSHKARWRREAYNVTGSTHTFPPEGFQSPRDITQRRRGNGTCNIANAAPHLHQRMEETKRIYDVQRGDVILHTRWLFHRTVAFDLSDTEEESSPPLYRRYSIRYGPGSSMIPRGYGTEPSVVWDKSNGGKSADQVVSSDAPWYPVAWENIPDGQLVQLQEIAQKRLPKLKPQIDARKKQMRQSRRSTSSLSQTGSNHQPH